MFSARRHARRFRQARCVRLAVLPAIAVVLSATMGGCSQPKVDLVDAYYRYDFPTARDALREPATVNDDDVLLNNLRLGVAALADGSPREAERGLRKSFDLLNTAGLNKDRTTAAVLLNDGVRVWKGEPFEQALAFYWTSALYATKGEWDNARAAASNSLFRLTDFGRDVSQRELVKRAAKDEKYLERYTAVDTNFALGFLMQAIGADRSGTAGAKEQFDAAARIDPRLGPLIEVLRSRQYDTLLLVDFGRGPQKVATGPDGAIAEFRPRERIHEPLSVAANGRQLGAFPVVCDVEQMAIDHRWNNLEDVRRAKSLIGNVLLYGGLTAAGIGAYNDSSAAALAGLGAALIGAYLKATSAADTRYCEFAPSAIYVAPLLLDGPVELRLQVGAGAVLVLPQFEPGTVQKPRAVFVRLLGQESPTPSWLTSLGLLYTNDHTGVRSGDFPWVMGGTDVGTPSPERLRAYQDGGALAGWTAEDLVRVWTSAGDVIGEGMEARADRPVAPSWRHVLEGGTGVFTPAPDSIGYKRIMFSPATVAPTGSVSGFTAPPPPRQAPPAAAPAAEPLPPPMPPDDGRFGG
jgi:hypothetical protein